MCLTAKPTSLWVASMVQVEVAGPEKQPLYRLAEQVLRANGDGRTVVRDDAASYFGVMLNDGSLTPDDDARIGRTTLEQWLAQSTVAA